jgi:hypothetical protein
MDLSQRLKSINHMYCGEVDPEDFAYFNYVSRIFFLGEGCGLGAL